MKQYAVNVTTQTVHNDFLRDLRLQQVVIHMLASVKEEVPVNTGYRRTRAGVLPAVVRYWIAHPLHALCPRLHHEGALGRLVHLIARRLTDWACETEEVWTTARVPLRVCPHVDVPRGQHRVHLDFLDKG